MVEVGLVNLVRLLQCPPWTDFYFWFPYHNIYSFNNAVELIFILMMQQDNELQLGNFVEGSACHESTGWDVDMSADGQTVIVERHWQIESLESVILVELLYTRLQVVFG